MGLHDKVIVFLHGCNYVFNATNTKNLFLILFLLFVYHSKGFLNVINLQCCNTDKVASTGGKHCGESGGK